MSISPREAMILSCALPPDAYRQLTDADVRRLANQFGVVPERVRQLASKLFGQIRTSGSYLDTCQPRQEGPAPT